MKHKRSISLLATAALITGFLAVVPPDEVMPVAVADPSPVIMESDEFYLEAPTPSMVAPVSAMSAQVQSASPGVTHRFHVAYVTDTPVANLNSFMSTNFLSTSITQAGAYWARETGNQISGFTIADIKVYTVPQPVPDWTDAQAYDSLFTNVRNTLYPGITNTNTDGDHLLIIAKPGPIWDHTQPSGFTAGGMGTVGMNASIHNGGDIRIRVPNTAPQFWTDIDTGASIWTTGLTGFLTYIVAHEAGHTLGLAHAGKAVCTPPSYDGPFNGPHAVCSKGARNSIQEYDDPNDIMGNDYQGLGYDVLLNEPLSAVRKSELGILTSTNNGLVELDTTNTYSGPAITLAGLETPETASYTYPKEIRITDGDAIYSIEYRDDPLPNESTTTGPAVRVLRLLSFGEYTGYPGYDNIYYTSYLTMPTTRGNTQYLQTGDSFTSASGEIHFTITNITTAGATINLQVGEQQPLTVSQDEWIAGPSYGGTDIELTSASGWTVDAPDWIDVWPTSGTGDTTVYLDVEQLQSPDSRSGTVTFTSTDNPAMTAIIDVTQENDDCGDASGGRVCIYDHEEMEATGIGGYSEYDWETDQVSGVTDTDRWYFTAPSTGFWGIYVSVISSESTGTLELYDGTTLLASSEIYSIYAYLTATLTAGHTYYIDYTLNPAWRSYAEYHIYATDDPDLWGDLTASCAELGPESYNCDIPTSLNNGVSFSSEGESLTMWVVSSTQWELSTPSWITAQPSSGSGYARVTYTAAPNTGGVTRSGDVVLVLTADPSQESRLTFHQAGDSCGDTPDTACGMDSLGYYYNPPEPFTGTLDYVGDVDWYVFYVNPSAQATFTSSLPGSSPLTGVHGTIRDASGTIIAEDDNGAGNGQFSIQASFSRGYYILEVRATTPTQVGDYTITVT